MDQTSDGYYKQYTYTETTGVSAPYEVETTTYRLWYELGTVKHYDTYYKVKVGTTTITQNAIKADNAIGISFQGNEAGGAVNINSANADVKVNSVLNNAGGNTSISAKNIVQGDNGMLKTDTLALTASGNVGALDNALQTNATKLSGSAGKDFAVQVHDNAVELGNITAGATAAITATSNITQATDAVLKAQRIELNATNGAIGASVDANGKATAALRIEAGVPADDVTDTSAYGLKAKAEGDIAITNSSSALYLDSVISTNGDVTLTTQGSFIDNNTSDVEDNDATSLVDKWINSQIVAGTEEAASGQRSMLCAKVDSKYNRYLALKDNIDEQGQYKLNAAERESLLSAHRDWTAADLAEYEAARTAEFASVKDAANWTPESIEAYKNSINNSTAAALGLAEADLKADDSRLASDAFLTREEKAEVLVGSTYRINDLLITFSPGLIKDVTDTNLSMKTISNVQGKNVTLNAVQSGASAADIGKTSSMTADFNALREKDYNSWTEEEKQLVRMLATAERGDIEINENGSATILMVDSIDVNAATSLKAEALNGNIYLTSEQAVPIDSITAGGEVRLKAAGSLSSAKGEADKAVVTSGNRVILESAGGSITQIELQDAPNMDPGEENELIARAQGDINLAKQATLFVDTVYSAGGDIVLDVTDSEGESTNDILGYGEAQNTNLKAKNINLLGAQNLGTKLVDGIPVGTSLGIELTDANGSFTATASDNADLLINGELKNVEVSADTLSLSNEGTINDGKFTATNALSFTNSGEVAGGAFSSQGNATIVNEGTVSGGTIVVGADANIDNQGTVSGGTINAAGDVNIANKGSVNNNTIMAQNVRISNEGELAAVNVSAKKDIVINSTTDVDLATAEAGAQLAIDSAADVSAGTLQAHSIDLAAGGSINVQAATSAADVQMSAGNDITAQSIAGTDINLTAGKDIKISSKSNVNALSGVGERGSVPVGATSPHGGTITADGRNRGTDFSKDKGTASISSTSGNITLNAGNTVAIDTLKTNGGHTHITANRVGIDDLVNTSNAASSLTISGQNGAAGYVGLTNSSAGELILKNSQIDELKLYSPDHITLQNLVVTNIADVYTDKVHVQIKDKPRNPHSMLVGKLSINGYDLSTKDDISRVSDGVTIDGKHSRKTHDKVAERLLFTDQYAGKNVDDALRSELEKERYIAQEGQYVEKGKETIIEFAEKSDDEEYIIIK